LRPLKKEEGEKNAERNDILKALNLGEEKNVYGRSARSESVQKEREKGTIKPAPCKKKTKI